MTPPPPSATAAAPPSAEDAVIGFQFPRPWVGRGKPEPEYPDSDGQPMADNTLQFRYIVLLKQGFDHLFADREDVFVAGDLLWYPLKGYPQIRFAPDVMIAFGRPKGERGSYRQWVEGDIPPQFVMEVLSPGNRSSEMGRKASAYLKYGAEEFVIYDPDRGKLEILVKNKIGDWDEISETNGWRSELTGVTFFLDGRDLIAVRPDGKKFEDYAEVAQRAAEQEMRAEAEAQEKEKALAAAAEEARMKDAALARAAELEARLREAGIEP